MAATGICALLTLGAGCTATHGQVPDGKNVKAVQDELSSKRIDNWSMPLDSYVPTDTHEADYAENLLVEPCMEKAGYSWPVPWQDIAKDHSPSLNPAGINMFNVSLAQQWGYHLAPVSDPSNATWRNFARQVASIPDAESTKLKACVTAARNTLPRLPGSAQAAAFLGSGAYEAALEDKPVLAAAEKWKQCMSPAGVSDLPASPRDMPSASLVSRYSISQDVSTDVPTVQAGERQVAVMDARCRTSSGYNAALYNDEWSRQKSLLTKNADELVAVRAELDRNKVAIEKVISLHAPQH